MRYLVALLLIPLLVGGLSGCGIVRAVFGQESAIQIAETREQKHWALVGTYDYLQESAEDIVTANDAPIELRRAVQSVEQCTTPAILELSNLYSRYSVERLLFEQGQSTLDKVEIAAANYDRWRAEAEVAVTDLSKAIGGEKSSCTP